MSYVVSLMKSKLVLSICIVNVLAPAIPLFADSFKSINPVNAKEMPMHTVIAIFEALPDQVDNLKKELVKVRNISRQGAGCLEYKVIQDAKNPARFILYEKWVNKEEHARQLKQDHVTAFFKKFPELLAAPVQAYSGQEIGA